MNKFILFFVILVVLILAYFLFTWVMVNPALNNNANNPPVTNTPPANNPPVNNPPASNPAINNVVIKNFTFSPSTITVKKGSTVVWINDDAIPHQVAVDGMAIGTIITTGNSYAVNFTKTGTYNYHCNIHPSMTGKVLVTN